MDDHIKHVLVLMLENRSFDHFLGGGYPRFDGVDPANPGRNRSKSLRKWFTQQPTAVLKLKPDPPHDTQSVLRQIDRGRMSGFVEEFERSSGKAKKNLDQVMTYFPWRTQISALHALADAFCVCDRWFSSVPGPTWTNRFFVHSGTSLGWVEMPRLPINWNLHDYSQDTIYDRLNQAGRSWRIYYGDIPQSLLLTNQWSSANRQHYRKMSEFEHDMGGVVDDGQFPDYVFIEPDYFWPGQNDQHPPSSAIKGDALIARVYNAIRDNDVLWESTLLVVTWDEHGGFYDHVEPPDTAVSPDGLNHEGFAFNRFGVRVPTILVSKWVQPGVLPHNPDPTKTLDHTSILQYLTMKFGLAPLGNRVSHAATFGGAFSQRANETAPKWIESLEEEDAYVEEENADNMVLNENQAGLLDFSERLERELESTPDEVMRRVVLAAQDIPSRIQIAKERVDRYIEMANVAVPIQR